MSSPRIRIICLANLRVYELRKELLNNWHEAKTIRAPRLSTEVRAATVGGVGRDIWCNMLGDLFISVDSREGVVLCAALDELRRESVGAK